MRNLLGLFLCCLIFNVVNAQIPLQTPSPGVPDGYALSVESYVEHDGTVGSVDLTGYTTYRVYLEMQNETDFLSCISGEADNPLILNSTSSPAWYNDDAFGAEVGAWINSDVLSFFPELAFDSWLTIGSAEASEGVEVNVAIGEIDLLQEFGSGENVFINDATGTAVYTLFPCESDNLESCSFAHGAFAGDDLRVLVGQFTTQGEITGQMQVQVFVEGEAAQEFRGVIPFTPYAPELLIPGCTDDAACNYAEEATEDDGSCDFCSCASDGSDYSMTVEAYAEDLVLGMTTYRFYQNMANTDDFLSSIYGNEDAPWSLDVTSSFYNSTFGGTTAAAINPVLFDFFPDLGADSWVTIGIESQPTGAEADISTVESENQPWISAFAANSAIDGQSIAMNDATGGAWYVLNGSPNGLPDDNGRVLFMQVTTDGELSGTINTQIFANGVGSSSIYSTYEFNGIGEYSSAGAACGCTDEAASNYDDAAEYDDGSCEYAVEGCTDASACNYNADATDEDGSCTYADAGYDCDGNCLADTDGDGICDDFEIGGCQDDTACNYNADATDDDGSCTYADAGYDCDGNCLADTDGDGICDEFETGGCTAPNACNYDSSATDDDGSCDFCSCATAGLPVTGYTLSIEEHAVDAVPGYTTYRVYQNLANADDFVSSVYGNNDDPLSISTTTGYYNSSFGGTTAAAINPVLFGFFPDLAADSWVTIGIESQPTGSQADISTVESQEQPWVSAFASGSALDGQDIEMADFTGGAWYVLNGTPNGLGGDDNRVLLMQLSTAGEFSGVINTQIFGNGLGENDVRNTYTFSGAGEYTADGGVVLNACGCTDVEASNYDDTADYDDGSCEYAVQGCIDDAACNYDADATDDDGSCTYADAGYDCDGNCLVDTDGDGICDDFEIGGCQDDTACNYNADATDDDGSCTYADAGYDCDGNCLVDTDGDGICDDFEIGGCQDDTACNYNADATDEDGSCTYADAGYDCDGNCLADTDADGICDDFEIDGCQDDTACNYNADATDDDGSCTYADAGYDCDGNCLVDTDGDGICDEFETGGCTAPNACNYDSSATDDDGSCDFCSCATAGLPVTGYTLSIEEHAVDAVPGYTTYRVYQNLANADDFVSSVYGNNDDPLSISTTTGYYNSSFGGTTAAAINPVLFGFFPDLAADSWVTIGIESQPTGSQADISTVESQEQPWVSAFASGSALDGQDIEMADFTGGAWYVLNGTPNGLGGDDNRVLLMQLSTAGEFSGVINTQIFGNGLGENDVRNTYTFSGAGEYTADGGVVLNACGCTDVEASNYDDTADYDDGSCEYAVQGCIDDAACNYDADATDDDGSCTYADAGYDCDGNCLVDTDGDGICDDFEIGGCQDDTACNYNADATDDDGSCTYADAGYDCDGNCLVDTDGDGICDDFEIGGCQDDTACNYNADATDDDGSCTYADAGYDCDGNCLADTDADGICDDFEIDGCQDDTACNYNADATDDDGSCTYADAGYDCDGNCLVDTDGDGICDEFEVAGCADATACNYDSDATDDDGSCTYADAGYDCDGNCLADTDGDGICDDFEIGGCQDDTACNYNADATDEDGSCTYANAGYDCDGECLSDVDGDNVCDEFEVAGCINPIACNYVEAGLVTDLVDCEFADAGYDCDGNCLLDTDGDGICDEFEVVGCLDEAACNYAADATDVVDCIYQEEGYDCDGNCLSDSDGDGLCDEFEIAGCTAFNACNYDSSATDDDGSCDFCSCSIAGLSSSDYSLTVEVHGVDLVAGQTTYRIYQNLANADDFVSSVYGNNDDPMMLSTTTGFYNSSFGGTTAAAINVALFGFFPDLAADSWVTIGIESQPTGSQADISVVESESQPWVGAFAAGSALDGQDFEMSDFTGGAWYVLNGTPNGLGDENNRVLLMQITTAGELTGLINTQIFEGGDGENDIRNNFEFSGPGEFFPGGNIVNNACGCTDEEAFNYDPAAEYDNDTCIDAIAGCLDAMACNYDDSANTEDGSCTYADAGYDCDGNCLVDTDGDGICDDFEIGGCQDDTACNYNADATDEDGSCTYADAGYDCDGNCLVDTDGDGICDDFEIGGCQDDTACNYNADATDEDGSCTYADAGYDCDGNCLVDTDGDGICDDFEIGGCQDDTACNYNADATDEDGSCTYADAGYDCDGNCLVDTDGDGICDDFEIGGCQDDTACNYNADATDDDGSCTYADAGYDCDGNCLVDTDADGICDDFEIGGCQDDTACNYNADATDEDGSCTYADAGYDCDGNCLVDTDGDGICDDFEIGGCQDDTACNYNADATDDDGSCTYADAGYGCDGNCLVDTDGDGICDDFEIGGCQDDTACNYNADATDDDGSCTYADAGYDCDGNCLADTDGDGICDEFEVAGCADATACNYDSDATDEDGSCTYADAGYDCDGSCLLDADGDGICDEFEVAGCADATACNYDSDATDEDGSCTYADAGYDCDGSCLVDADGDGICDDFEIAGCTDAEACNYNEDATQDDGTCAELDSCGVCGGVGFSGDVCDCDGNILDECGVCGGDGIPEGACDCDGNVPVVGYDCDGNCNADADGDGICDDFEIGGCQDDTACNYNADATDGDNSCTYAEEGFDCDGNCLQDGNNDGLCDIEGCTILEACNYDPNATLLLVDDCEFPIAEGYACYEVITGCMDIASVNFNPFATVDDGSCISVVVGCMLPFACTFDPAATIMDISMCVFGPCEGTGGTPLPEGMLFPGCMDPSACNFDPEASENDWASCDYSCLIGCNNDLACNYDPQVLYPDGSCDFESCAGCTSVDACNYDETATIPDAGACDFVSCLGCPAAAACNYNPEAILNDFFTCEYCEFDFVGAADYNVECESDLPAVCDGAVAVNSTCSVDELEVACLLAENITGEAAAYTATTAMGNGPDGAFRLYGASVQGVADSDFFLEDPANPLQLVRYENGVAILTGSIVSDVNPDQRFDVFVSFEEGQAADSWLAEDPDHGFLVAFGCEPNIEEVFTLKGDQSYLVGQGDYEGDLITLSHMPVSENKRFQLGIGGNSHNCNFGFGGWFAWSGTLMNTPAGGMSGDIIVDLAPDSSFVAATCGNESVSIFYTALETNCDYVETHVQTITRIDTAAPEFTSAPADATVECDAVPSVIDLADLLSSGELLAVDACEADDDALEYAYEGEAMTPTSCDSEYTLERTWSATDCSGNTATYTQVITIEDTTAPAFTEALPTNATVECDAVPAAEVLTAADNCDASVVVSFEEEFTNGSCPQAYTITRVWSVVDCAGNEAEHVQLITVQDTTAPIIEEEAMSISVECDGAGNAAELNSWLASNGGASASDACGNVTWSNDFSAFSDDCGATGGATVIFTATDDCGNSITSVAAFTIEDTVSPVIEDEAMNLTVECDGTGNASDLAEWLDASGGAAATDLCSGVDWTNDFESLSADCAATGAAIVTFTAMDACGNTATTSATFTIEDTTAPVFESHDEFTMASCDMITDAEDVTQMPLVATDNCGSITYDVTAVLFSGGCPGTWMRQWTATDECGNAAQTLQFITLYDEVAPEFISFPDNVVLDSDASCSADTSPAVTGTPEITDNCGDNVNVTLVYVDSPVVESCPGSYSFTRTWIATDFCGNQSTQDQLIEVIDATGPVFTLAPADQNNQCQEQPYAYAAEDNCTETVIIYENRDTLSSDDCGNYVHLVSLEAHDVCGNITTHQFMITVADTQAPNWNEPIPLDATVECGAVPAAAIITATDNCDDVSIVDFNEIITTTDCEALYSITRTWSVADCTGNSAFAIQNISVVDSEAPSFVEQLPADITVECNAVPEAEVLTAVDNCDADPSVEITDTISDETCNGTYTLTRSWLASDCAGNETEHIQVITVQDTTAPTVVDAMDATVECDGAGNAADLDAWLASNGGASATDACSGVTWSNDFDALSDDCGATGAATVTFSATDACGNATSTTATFTIEDTTAPTRDADAMDATVECDGAGNAADLDAWLASNGGASATDACSGVTWSNDFDALSDDCGATGAATVTFSATDACGNATSTTATFTIEDTTAPAVVDAMDATVECDGAGNAADLDAWLASNGGASATDACSGVTWSNDFDALSDDCGATGAATVTFSATDACGNATNTTATFTIEDTTAPAVVDAMDATVECDGAGNAADLDAWLASNGGASATDACSGVTWSNDFDALSDDCGATGAATVTFSATDACGNATSTTATFTIEDTTAPAVVDAMDATVECDGAGNAADLDAWLASNGGASATDACSGVTWSNDFDALSDDCGATGAATVTFSATDACGNATNTTATFTIEDTTAPAVVDAMDATVECDGAGNAADLDAWLASNGGASATDACSGVTWSNDFDALSDDCGATGAATVTFSATDACGNATSTTATFTIEDTTAPTRDADAMDATVECDGAGNAADLDAWLASNGGASATDACSGVTWSNDFDALSDDCGATGAATVTFSATDACGNATSTTATFTIEDTTAPAVADAMDATVECDGAGNAADLDAWLASNGGASATDACSGVTWSNDFDALSDDCGATGAATVTFSATDACGNATNTTATFTIEDTTAPAVVDAMDATVECDGAGNAADLDAWLASNGGASATDACSGVTWSNDYDALSDDCGATGAATVTFSATDACGNATNTTATFTIEDTTAPAVVDAMDATVECDGAGNAADLDAWLASNGGASATDACSGVTWSNDFDALSDDCGATGAATVTFSATDACGNATSTTATFTIEDTTAPTRDADAMDSTVECDGAGNAADLDAWLASNGGASATDACSGVTWSNDFDTLSSDCGTTGAATVTFSATDACGNATSTTATFTIEDTQGPIITVEPQFDLACETYDPNEIYGASFVDACSADVTVTFVDAPGAGGCLNINQSWYIRTYTATDACGNVTTEQQQLHLIDDVAPTITIEFCPADVTIEFDDACGYDASVDVLGMATASATDNCDMPEVSIEYADSDTVQLCGSSFSFTRTFSVSSADACGNEAAVVTCSQIVTVTDAIAPAVIDAMDATVECDGAGNAADLDAWLASNGGASATDACSGVTWSNDFDALSDDCGASGVATVTFSATDACGNATSTTATFTIEDTTAPAVMDAMDATAECDGAGNAADLDAWLASNGGASATDACSGVTWTNDFDGLTNACGPTGSALVNFTATDACGNAASTTATFTIEDTTAPSVVDAMDATVECDGTGNAAELDAWLASNGGASATDACSGVTWSNDFDALSDDCGATGSANVTFSATDACGNATSTTATFTMEDTTSPEFTQVPADQSNQCEELNYTALAADACSAVEITESREVISEDGCGNYEHLVTLTAADACGNETTHAFTIVVSDTEAPEITDSEGVENGGIVPVCAEDVWGTISIPEALNLTALDNCTGDVEVTMTESYVGEYAPTDDVTSFCMPADPAAMEDGLTCDNFTSHAARLFNFPGEEFYTLVGGLITNNADGSAHLTMDVVGMGNANAGWTFEVDLNEGLNWQDWVDQPGPQSFKSDCGLGDHTEWMYHIMQSSSTASGWGEYEGSELSLSHQPSNGFFGFQVGEGANNKNANHGYSGWFYYMGTFNGADVMGTGDVFGDLDCSLPWSIEREYTVADCSGNTTTFAYTIDINGMTCEPIDPTLGGDDSSDNSWGSDAEGDGAIGEDDSDAGSEDSKLRLLGLNPNPVNEMALLSFATSVDELITVNVYNNAGVLVTTLFQGQVFANVPMTLEVLANMFETGLYQIQIVSDNGSITTKLMVGS